MYSHDHACPQAWQVVEAKRLSTTSQAKVAFEVCMHEQRVKIYTSSVV